MEVAINQIPFFFGPLHITASLGLVSKNPIDINDKLSSIYYKKRSKINKRVLLTLYRLIFENISSKLMIFPFTFISILVYFNECYILLKFDSNFLTRTLKEIKTC